MIINNQHSTADSVTTVPLLSVVHSRHLVSGADVIIMK